MKSIALSIKILVLLISLITSQYLISMYCLGVNYYLAHTTIYLILFFLITKLIRETTINVNVNTMLRERKYISNLLNKITSKLAHEINSPLLVTKASIKTFEDARCLKCLVTEDSLFDLNLVNEQLEVMFHLVRKLMTPLVLTDSNNMYTIINDGLQTIIKTNYNIKFDCFIDPRLKYFNLKELPEDLFYMIILNMLANSIQAEATLVSIKIETESDHKLLISILDNGKGMDKIEKINLFKQPNLDSLHHISHFNLFFTKYVLNKYKCDITHYDKSKEGTVFLLDILSERVDG